MILSEIKVSNKPDRYNKEGDRHCEKSLPELPEQAGSARRRASTRSGQRP
ncbi:MAG: hypothetical protein ISS29_08050 [Candidatus Marinimicrobia bacterium]|nr:hypothetical protein [Candidatus Neomarinimicrobiota bacterium]